MKELKSLGVLGLGSQSTLFYIQELNNIYNKNSKGFSTCPFKLLNTNFDTINSLLPNTSELLDSVVKQYIDELIRLSIDLLLVPNITLHQTLDRLNIGIPVIHPIQITIDKLESIRATDVVLIASVYTMKSDYVRNYFDTHAIKLLLPTEKEMLLIDEARKGIYACSCTKAILAGYNSIVEKYSVNNLVVIACTELSLGLENKENKNVFDMSRIQIQKAVSLIV